MEIEQSINKHEMAASLASGSSSKSPVCDVDDAKVIDDREDGDSSHSDYSEDSDDSGDDSDVDDNSVTLQEILARELFGKQHCLHKPSKAAKRGFGTLEKLKRGDSRSKPIPKVASSSDLFTEEMMSAEEAHASFERFLIRKSRSMENLSEDIDPRPHRKGRAGCSTTSKSVKKPEECLKSLLAERGIGYKSVPASTLATQGFFVEMQNQNYADYTDEIAFAARRGDVVVLKAHVASGKTAQCCNRHKESIIHTICRKGHKNMLEYVMDVAGASIRICCDQFRTPLHDAAWTHEPNFEMIKIIIDACPDLLYVEDCRGHTPLAYVASPQYNQWCKFLEENVDCLSPVRI